MRIYALPQPVEAHSWRCPEERGMSGPVGLGPILRRARAVSCTEVVALLLLPRLTHTAKPMTSGKEATLARRTDDSSALGRHLQPNRKLPTRTRVQPRQAAVAVYAADERLQARERPKLHTKTTALDDTLGDGNHVVRPAETV